MMNSNLLSGGVAEWLKAAVLKTVVPQGTVGSNPTSSAINFSMPHNKFLSSYCELAIVSVSARRNAFAISAA